MTTFGAVLHAYRERARLSQAESARRAGINPSYFWRLEAGRQHPSYQAVLAISRGLGATPRQERRLLMAAGYLPAEWARPEIRALVEAILARDVATSDDMMEVFER